MDEKTKKAIDDFCIRAKMEKELREGIAGIMAKLNRSNLSAVEGERHAKSLMNAYTLLKELEAS